MHRVLIVDDEPRLARILENALDGLPCDVVHDAQTALDRLSPQHAVLVTDVRMAGMDGMQLLREVRRRAPQVKVIVMTAFARAEDAVEAMKLGAQDYLVKPFDLDEFRHKVVALMPAGTEPVEPGHELEGLVGRSPAMRDLFELVEKVAPRDATVLILGESGTGKDLVAKALHARSKRAAGPFIDLHCGALPEVLLESELFGHEKGAFPGASARKIGRLEAARGGTLFLDEVGDLPAGTQGRLLRFLNSRTFTRMGGAEPLMVDARLVCATSRDLVTEVAASRFRADLFYRLDVFPVRVPPLRDRSGDVALLIRHFLEKAGRDPLSVSPDVVDRLSRASWPGNVRELENAIGRALILAGDGRIEARHVPQEQPPQVHGHGHGGSLDEMEMRTIEEALQKSGGNKSHAAALLGITRRRLYSRLESLGRKLGR